MSFFTHIRDELKAEIISILEELGLYSAPTTPSAPAPEPAPSPAPTEGTSCCGQTSSGPEPVSPPVTDEGSTTDASKKQD